MTRESITSDPFSTLAQWEAMGEANLLSVVIPAHNEEATITHTVLTLVESLQRAQIAHEILVINDNSTDSTEEHLLALQNAQPTVRYLNNHYPQGFGFAIRYGLSCFRGDAVAIVMADGCDSPEDLVNFYNKLRTGYDCVFGSRFTPGGHVVHYPRLKLLLNRMGNTVIRLLFLIHYNDITNAFKLYRRCVIAGVQPLLSAHFNLTVEIPLKAVIRGYRVAVLPNSWHNRVHGSSKFKIKEVASRYLCTLFYCFFEKWLWRDNKAHWQAMPTERPPVAKQP
ncbi:glycosyltransferase family 2 protein [Candidatus Magnetaquicoccus inordinatus]|uniref:glycosyltransferase family 2 protein n=1 Tax=Candidatus Magnetaquicoccus inordinatus TaxID=2496818 RepID=UPI00102AB6B3|nr:glycosyltransferase family 2 protein [Candidatus Magnetaquicoccus inordinatus]